MRIREILGFSHKRRWILALFLAVCAWLVGLAVVVASGTFSVTGSIPTPTPTSTPAAWERTFGGPSDEYGQAVEQMPDGGYVIAAYDHDAGSNDGWLIRVDPDGNQQWAVTFGGSGVDGFKSVRRASDGGYVLAGTTTSYGAGYYDVWLVKTSSSGDMQWQRTFGTGGEENADAVQQTSDGGYIISGYIGGGSTSDVWLIKTDALGNKEWDSIFGGSGGAHGKAGRWVQQTSDGGYIVFGQTDSFGAGGDDFWLIKTDALGNKEWDKTFGGPDWDFGTSGQQTSDGGYVIAGYTRSFGAGGYDVWLVKTDSSGNKQWDRTFGGSSDDVATSVRQSSDGGYVIAGRTNSYGAGGGDFWLLKTDAGGNEVWSMTFGGANHDEATAVQQTSDGGYVLVGYTSSYGAGGYDVWLVRTLQPAPTPTPTPTPIPAATAWGLLALAGLLAVALVLRLERARRGFSRRP